MPRLSLRSTVRSLAPCVGLLACSRYEWRPDYPPVPPPPRVAARLNTIPAPPGVLAAQLHVPPGMAEAARPWRASLRPLAPGAAWTAVPVDPVTGRLRVDGLAPGAYELNVYGIGLGPRRDTLSVTAERGTAVVLEVAPSPTIAPMEVRVRKPWWKLW